MNVAGQYGIGGPDATIAGQIQRQQADRQRQQEQMQQQEQQRQAEMERQRQQMAAQQQQQQQQSSPAAGGLNPAMISKFTGGGASGGGGAAAGGASGGGAAAGTGGAAASGGAATAGGGTAAGGGASGAGGAMAAAGPWAALAAVIAVNEKNARDGGYRSEDNTQYAKDLIGGKVFEQDMGRFGEKVDPGNKHGFKADMQAFGDLSTFDFSNAWDNAKKGTLGKLLGLD